MLTKGLKITLEEICEDGLLMSTQVMADAELLLGLGDKEMDKRGIFKQDIEDMLTLAKSIKTLYVYALAALNKEEPDLIEYTGLIQQALELTVILDRTSEAVAESIEDNHDECETCNLCGKDSEPKDNFAKLPENVKKFAENLMNDLGISMDKIKIVDMRAIKKED